MAFTIIGQLKVGSLKKRFHDEFGLTLRVYEGREFANDDRSIAQIRKKTGTGELAVRKSMKVGSLEEKILKEYGIKVQIAGGDDSYLCDDNLTLAGALEKDTKKSSKKKTKTNTSTIQPVVKAQSGSFSEYVFANKLFKKAGVSIEFSEENYDNVFTICRAIKGHVNEINGIDVADGKELSAMAETALQNITVENVWKIALICQTIENEFIKSVVVLDVEDVLGECEGQEVNKWQDAVTLLSEGLNKRNTSDDVSEAQTGEASDFALGCFFLAVEPTSYRPDSEDFDLTDAQEGIYAWVTGFGNCFEYDDPVGGIIDEIESCSIKDKILDAFIDFIGLYYDVNVNDCENDDETINWEQVAEEVGARIL